jgi:hypothetical protein
MSRAQVQQKKENLWQELQAVREQLEEAHARLKKQND